MSRKIYMILSTLLIFAFALTACGAPATQAPAATDEPAATEPSAATEAPAATEEPAASNAARSPLVRVRLPAPSTPSMTMSTRRA